MYILRHPFAFTAFSSPLSLLSRHCFHPRSRFPSSLALFSFSLVPSTRPSSTVAVAPSSISGGGGGCNGDGGGCHLLPQGKVAL